MNNFTDIPVSQSLSINKQNHISDVFDNVMSDSKQQPSGSTSLAALRQQQRMPQQQQNQQQNQQRMPQQKMPQQNQQKMPQQKSQQRMPQQKPQQRIPNQTQQNQQQRMPQQNQQRMPQQKPKQNNNYGRKLKLKKIKRISQSINNIQSNELDQNKQKLVDISKKALIGSVVYLILSLPITIKIFEKIVSSSSYKNIIVRTLLFAIIFTAIAKFLYI